MARPAWVRYRYFGSVRLSRITGYASVDMHCVLCGSHETVRRCRVPRFGPLPREPQCPQWADYVKLHGDRLHSGAHGLWSALHPHPHATDEDIRRMIMRETGQEES
jgi:hypothetical protein